MYRAENLSETKKANNKSNLDRTQFKEILCPLSKNELIIANCISCGFCQKMKGVHYTSRTLTSLICMYNNHEDESSDT